MQKGVFLMQKQLQKAVLGAILAAMAVGINLFFAYVIGGDGTFGLPIYSIPLIISSIYLGPLYGFLVGFVADLGIGFLGPFGYKPLFVLSTLSWSVIPGLFIRKKYNLFKMIIAVFVAYVLATAGNTLALIVHYDSNTAISSLIYRIPSMLVLMTPLVTLSHLIYKRILDYQDSAQSFDGSIIT